jgi:UDP-N-acetylmuramoyl-tripeptide--D-alanyl-D-alanine ligase
VKSEPAGSIPAWPASAVRDALGLSPLPEPEPEIYSTISTDSRSLEAGALFVALQGERFDGHDHLAAAAAAGAAGAVVRQNAPAVKGLALYRVDDTLRAFGLLARYRRMSLDGPVIAVTGTNGKTSTKEMLLRVLSPRYRTHATRANLNNLVGVPQTILEAPLDVEALIVEAGANLPGEIARYREIIQPTITLVTNAVQGHLEGFGSLAGVVQEKLSLTEGVPLAIVGVDPPQLVDGARQRARRARSAAIRNAELTPDRVTLDEQAHPILTFGDTTFTLAIRGLHQADNAVRVWAVVEALGLDPRLSAAALERVSLPEGRGELIQEGQLTVLNDSYNANPQSFRAAIATAAALRRDRRLIFVAGTMRELGADAAALHREIAALLVDLHPELLAVVGDFVPALEPFARALGHRLVTAPDPLALAPLLAARVRGDELVVLKASRGVALERILPALKARARHTSTPGAPLISAED